ncbi:MAG: hypothetical protein RL329_1130 [Bacteroidota bacterium]|jgi:hypothetical protein
MLNIHLFFYQQNQIFKMKKDLKSLLSEENMQVLVADDMAVVKGGKHGCRKSKSKGHHGHGHHGHSKGQGGWGGCVPPRPRPRPCPPRPRC